MRDELAQLNFNLMTSSFGKKPFFTKWRLQMVLWIILFILVGVFIIYVFVRESKDEEDFQKHLDKEHSHSQ